MSSSSDGHYAAIGGNLRQTGKKHQEKHQSDGNAVSWACHKDKLYIEKLERELSNCYQEIEYLQDQLKLRTVETNYMGEHIHSLELKLTELEKFPERVKVMGNELAQSDSQCFFLMEEVRCKEEELQKSGLQMQKLEAVVLDSQCEVESIKLDLTAMEQRLFEAESFGQQVAGENARMEKQLKEYEFQLQEAQQVVGHLEVENKQLKELLPERNAKRSSFTVREQLGKTLHKMNDHIGHEGDHTILLQEMAKQNQESELLIEQLKEELREQKVKAKEDAEDLTQEMAELRYEITGMLEEEYKRRSCIEQAAIQRIQQLETQVSKEQKRLNAALKRLQESHELAQRQTAEIKKLKGALERFNGTTDLGTACRTDSCFCGLCAMSLQLSDCSIEASIDVGSSDINYTEKPQNRALPECPHDEASDDGAG